MKTTDVHEAMKEAQLRRWAKPEFVTASYKVDQNTKEIVDEICNRHGVTTSEWIRECCYALVKDYLVPPTTDQ
jgi:hypothetical protein